MSARGPILVTVLGDAWEPRAFDDVSIEAAIARGWTLRHSHAASLRLLTAHRTVPLEWLDGDPPVDGAIGYERFHYLVRQGYIDLEAMRTRGARPVMVEVLRTEAGEKVRKHLSRLHQDLSTRTLAGRAVLNDLTLAVIAHDLFQADQIREKVDEAAQWRRDCEAPGVIYSWITRTGVRRIDGTRTGYREPPWLSIAGSFEIATEQFLDAYRFLIDHGLVSENRTTPKGYQVMSEYQGSVEAYLRRENRLRERRATAPAGFITTVNTGGGDVTIGSTGHLSGGTIEQRLGE